MTTPNNIAAVQGATASAQPKGKAAAGSPQGLLGFFDVILQQINADLQSKGQLTATPNAPAPTSDMKGLEEKIAALLKKDGLSAADLQKMPPQDLTAAIAQLLGKQEAAIPAGLQDISTKDLSTQLAALLQSKNAGSEIAITASAGTFVKPTLTSDLAAAQSKDVQAAPPTKADIAQKIANFLEKNQNKTGAAEPVTPAQLAYLKTRIAHLQDAPGTVPASTLSRLTTDLGTFLSSHGVDQPAIASFIADMTKTLQKPIDKTADTAADPTTTAAPPAAAVAQAPLATPPQSANGSAADNGTSAQKDPTSADMAAAKKTQPTTTDHSRQTPPKTADGTSQDKPEPYKGLGTTASPEKTAAKTAAQAHAPQTNNTIAPEAQQAAQQPQGLTAKMSGLHSGTATAVTALASAASGSGDSAGGDNSGFNAQDGSAQTQGPSNMAALLQTASSATGKSFTNYLSAAAHSAPSPTTQMVNIQLMQNINAGMNAMSFQLEPAGLGRLDVKLKFAKDGSVKAHMTVDKPETLALLQKDSSHLQRALQQSGLHADDNSLSFDLRQQNQQQNSNGYNGNGRGMSGIAANARSSTMNALHAQIAIQAAGYISRSGVNIMV